MISAPISTVGHNMEVPTFTEIPNCIIQRGLQRLLFCTIIGGRIFTYEVESENKLDLLLMLMTGEHHLT